LDINIELYANWKLERYEILYSLQGGVNNETNPNSYNIEEEINLNAPSRLGYNFLGWSSDGIILKGSKGVKTFSANWSPTVFKIEYDLNGGNNNLNNPALYTIESSNIALLTPSKIGYQFINWSPLEIINHGSNGDITITANWSAIVYNINYDLNGGLNHHDNPHNYTIETGNVSLLDPSKPGYLFDKWLGDTIELGTLDNKSFYATWLPIRYNIIYELDGGLNNIFNSSTFTVEDLFSLDSPSKPGYVFDGWYLDSNYLVGIYDINGTIFNDITIYAKWIIIGFNIIYDLNGGINGLNILNYNVSTPEFTLFPAKKIGYDFLHWINNEDEIVTSVGGGTTGDLELRAIWIIVTYSIVYDDDLSASLGNPTEYNINTPSFDLLIPSKIGYSFEGWYLLDEVGNPITKIDRINQGSNGNLKLKATFSIINYSITYDYNGGVFSNNLTNYTIITPTFLLSFTSKVGYEFKGWFEEEDSFNSDGSLDKIEIGSTGDLFLRAEFVLIYYSISYDYKNGSITNTIDRYTIETESFFFLPSDKKGYDFEYWKDSNGEILSQVTQGSASDLTVTAWFVPHTYNIIYRAEKPIVSSNEAIGITKSSLHTYDLNANLSKNEYSIKGWEFLGWSKFNNDIVDFLDEEILTENLTSINNATIELYAVWNPIKYTIVYNGNDAENEILNSSSTHYYDQEQNLNTNLFVKSGYHFLGWTEIPNATLKYTDSEKVLNISYIKGDVYNLYASFFPNSYKIVYNGDNYTSGEMNSSDHYYDNFTTFLLVNNFTKTGYEFIGWSFSVNGSIVFHDGDLVQHNLTSTNGDLVNLYAVWDPIKYTIIYNGNRVNAQGSTLSTFDVNYDSYKTLAVNGFTVLGYVFVGWSESTTGKIITSAYNLTSKDRDTVTLYAQWNPQKYKITYSLTNLLANHPENPSEYTIESSIITFKNPTPYDGYSFVSWSKNVIPIGSYGDVFVNPVLKNNVYTITYELNGGLASNNEKNYEVTYANSYVLIIPTKSGYNFAGWYEIVTNQEKFYTNNSGVSLGVWSNLTNKTLLAKWEAKKYTVTLNPQQDGVSNVNITVTFGESMPKVDNLVRTLVPPVKIGYTFNGYFSETNGGGVKYYDRYFVSVTEWNQLSSITLYANWNPNTYSVILEGQNDSQNITRILVIYEESMPSAIIPLRIGYSFNGYFSEMNGLGEKYYDLNMKSMKKWDVPSSTTLYAYWIPKKYQVLLDSKVGVFSLNATYDSSMPSTTVPFRGGFSFLGYFTESDGKGVQYYDSDVKSTHIFAQTSTLILYANWTIKTTAECYNSTTQAYEIWLPLQLNGIRNLSGGTSLRKFTIMQNISLVEFQEWTPIPEFRGTLEGNNKQITNLTIKAPYTGEYGLIGCNHGFINNLTVSGTIKIFILDDNSQDYLYIGLLAGVNRGYIDSCKSNSIVSKIIINDISNPPLSTPLTVLFDSIIDSKIVGLRDNSQIGGLVGVSFKSIENCTNNSSVAGQGDVGGIVGALYDGGQVYTCTNNGEIGYSFKESNRSAGGIVGFVGNGIVSYCTNKGNIKYMNESSDSRSLAPALGQIVGCKKAGSVHNNILNGTVDIGTLHIELWWGGNIFVWAKETHDQAMNAGNREIGEDH
ncbi:hypothetical protein EZS27_017615, partial [termite gut metagenome]